MYIEVLPLLIAACSALPLPVPAPELLISLLPSRPRMSSFQDGYRLLSSVDFSLDSSDHDQNRLYDSNANGPFSVEAHEFVRPFMIGSKSYDLNLEPTVHDDPFEFCMLQGHTSSESLPSDCAFIVHLGVPEDLVPAQLVPYMVTPSPQATSDQLEAHWQRWQLTPSPLSNTYAFNFGELHIVLLDTGASPDDLLNWLKIDLASLNRDLYPHVIVAGCTELPKDMREELDDILAVHDVEALVLGVDHGRWIHAIIDADVSLTTYMS